jgi:hypothetical protein
MGLLAQTAEPAKEVLAVERIAVVADRGYFKPGGYGDSLLAQARTERVIKDRVNCHRKPE